MIRCMMWSQRLSEVLTQPSTGLLSFTVLSALWTFEINGSSKKPLTKPMGDQESRIISHQLIGLLVSFGFQILLPNLILICLVVCCSTSQITAIR